MSSRGKCGNAPIQWLYALIALMITAGCDRSPVESIVDDYATHSAFVAGRALFSEGRPISGGIVVAQVPEEASGDYTFADATTAMDGSFVLRVDRVSGESATRQDTVSAVVIAYGTVRRSDGTLPSATSIVVLRFWPRSAAATDTARVTLVVDQ